MEAILDIGSKSPVLMTIIAEAALILNEQAEELRKMERIRDKREPADKGGG